MKNRFLNHLDASVPLSSLRMGMAGMESCSAITKETDGGKKQNKK